MQIGDEQLDQVCDEAMVPAIESAGFSARRVDRHNAGDLLKSEIVGFIERSQVIVADITNERPNCYLEIGYAMGLGKKANLILTVREDHYHDSPNYDRNGPKIHFDLAGYDILFWDPLDLTNFRVNLAKRIKRRAAMVKDAAREPPYVPGSSSWRDELRAHGEAGLAELDREGYMEVVAQVRPPIDASQSTLLNAIQTASVHNFGWPIGIVLDNRDEYRPRPTSDGVVAEVAIPESPMGRRSYDYWKLFRDGRFYSLLSLFEDEKSPGTIFFEWRIMRVTEALLLAVRLYRRLGSSDGDEVTVTVRHSGLAGRSLDAANPSRDVRDGREATENEAEATITASLSDLELNLTDYVVEIVGPLFMLFDFLELDPKITTEIAEKFINER